MGDSIVVSTVLNSQTKFPLADAVQHPEQSLGDLESSQSPEHNSRSPLGLKRSHSESTSFLMEGSEPDAKRMAAVAAATGDFLRAGIPRGTLPAMGMPAMMAGLGPVTTEELMVPDKMVGLIIGRGGEQISRLQAESGAKIQMAPDSAGLPERACTITGSREAITRAREMISSIIQTRGGPRDAGPPAAENMASQHSVEVMIPGPKVGLIIGKGGDTIKQLQERTGTRMVVVQEGPHHESEKPLRIFGDPQKVEHAKQMVYELIADKEMDIAPFERGQRPFGGFGGPGGGGGPQQSVEVAVPRSAVGVVIGKNGETIKKIQSETGARIQFQQARDDNPEDRMCALTGSPSQIQEARQRIEDLIESVLARDSQMGRGRGRGGINGAQFGRSPSGGGSAAWGEFGPGGGRGGPGMGMMRNGQDKIEYQYLVPANKTGIVIGKGGETIKQINQQSGAFCELDRRPPPNPNEKMFIIRGSAEQVELAKRMIAEKLGLGPMGSGGSQYPMGQGPPSAGFTPQNWGSAYQQWPGQGAELAKPDHTAAWAAYYQQQYFQQGSAPSAAGQPPQTPGGPEGGAGALNPQTGQPDYTAQWIQYYRSMGAHKEAEALEQQLKAAKGMTNSSGAPAAAAAAAPSSQPQDYSAQWIAYYRSIGKIQEAEALEAQARMKQTGQVPGQQGAGGAQAFFPAAGGLAAPGGAPAPAGAAGFYGQSGLGQPQGAYSFPGNYGGYQAPVGEQ